MIDLADAPTPTAPRSRRRWIALAAAVALLLGAGIAFQYWRTHAILFAANQGSAESGTTSYGVGGPDTFNMFVQPVHSGATVDIRSITPVVFSNSAAATFTAFVCTPPPHGPMVNGGTPAEVSRYCASLTPFHPGKITFGDGVSLFVRSTPHQSGSVVLHGVRIAFRDGIRTGHQTVGGYVDLEPPAPTK